MTSSADCDCWFLRLEGRHYEDCNKGHKNPPRADPRPAPVCTHPPKAGRKIIPSNEPGKFVNVVCGACGARDPDGP